MDAGYSKTTLAKKLGIKAGNKIMLINAPAYYFDLFTDMPEGVITVKDANRKKHFIHFFTKDYAELARVLPLLRNEIVPDGMIWVSWPKKAAKIVMDVSEDLIREVGLNSGLVDIKVCAVDEIWSGLKFVIPVKDRTASH